MGVNICKKIIIQKNFNKKSIIPYSYIDLEQSSHSNLEVIIITPAPIVCASVMMLHSSGLMLRLVSTPASLP